MDQDKTIEASMKSFRKSQLLIFVITYNLAYIASNEKDSDRAQ